MVHQMLHKKTVNHFPIYKYYFYLTKHKLCLILKLEGPFFFMICLTDLINFPLRPCKMILVNSANIKGSLLNMIKEPLMSIQGAFVLQLVGSQPVAVQL